MSAFKPFRDAKFHGEMQGHLQTFIRWSVAPEESPTGRAPSREMLDETAGIAADADPNAVTR
jgi:hypothetical protein